MCARMLNICCHIMFFDSIQRGGGDANANFNNFSVAQNFKYAGLQNGNQCFCDDTYGGYGKVDESKCTKLCTGDPSLLCGGAWANMIYRTY